MKNGLVLFLGVFLAFALSWTGLLLTAHRQLGSLGQFKDPVEETLNPQPLSGVADQGRLVYQDLGCVACHTQQVRREGFGSDLARKWGQRGGYARDYIRDKTVFLGSSRLGPDLRNVGARISEADYFYRLLYAPEASFGGAPIAHGMPAYAFLFEVHPTAGRQPSDHAVNLPGKYGPAPGNEVVPTTRARALVAYLLSLKDTYDYPLEKSRNVSAEKPGEEHAGNAKPPTGTPVEKPKDESTGNAQPPAGAPAEKPKEGGH